MSTSRKAARDRAFAEQALASADNHRKLPDAQRIDEIALEQGLDEVAAAVDLNLVAILCLELRDLLGYVALEQVRIVPGDFIERPRSDELRPGVEGRSDLVRRVGGLGPGRRENLIGLAADKKGAGALWSVEAELVDQAVVRQSGRECRATDAQGLAQLSLETRHLFDGFTADEPRVPLDVVEGLGEDDLGHGPPDAGVLGYVVRARRPLICGGPVLRHQFVHHTPIEMRVDRTLEFVEMPVQFRVRNSPRIVAISGCNVTVN